MYTLYHLILHCIALHCSNGWFYVDRLRGVQSLRSEIGCGTRITELRAFFSLLLHSSLFRVLFCTIRMIRSSPTHHPCVYIFLFQRWEPVLCMQSDALNPDLQPKKLCLSIPKHAESLALSLIPNASLNTMIFVCKTPRVDE
jgi:hypothetical protein